MKQLAIFLLLIYFCPHILSLPTPPPFMTTPDIDVTDMPKELSLKALDVFKYRYNNTEFHFQDNQDLWEMPRPKGLIYPNNCFRQYFKCLISQSSPEPVCAYNQPFDHVTGYASVSSSCDVYFDNCRRGYRVWRILDTGICRFQKEQSMNDHVAKDKSKPKYINRKSWQP